MDRGLLDVFFALPRIHNLKLPEPTIAVGDSGSCPSIAKRNIEMLAHQDESNTTTEFCYHCNGQGLFIQDAISSYGEVEQTEYECDECQGTGISKGVSCDTEGLALKHSPNTTGTHPVMTKESVKGLEIMSKPKSIYLKILEAQKNINYVQKNGTNSFHKYDYAMESDILHTVKQAANDAGLILVTSMTSELGSFSAEKMDYNGNKVTDITRFAKVTLSYKVIDAETGEAIEGTFDGYSEDKGDKAIYKATTGANKYFLMKFFGVPTGDDPEKDQKTEDDTQNGPPANRKPSAPTKIHERKGKPVVVAGIGQKDSVECVRLTRELVGIINSRALNAEEVRIYGKIDSIDAALKRGDVEALRNALHGCQAKIQQMKEAI